MLTDLRFAMLTALLIASGTAAGCSRHEATPAATAQGPPVAVQIRPFGTAALAAGLVLPARVRAAEEITLTARTAGRLTALPAREGTRVRRGEAVARFDAPETRNARAAAHSELDAAAMAATVAARQSGRIESLFVARVVAPSDRETAQSAGRDAEARLARARANVEQIETAVTLRAPFDGVVVRRHADVGADLAPGSPVVDLRSSGPLEVVVSIPEGAVTSFQHASIEVETAGGTWRTATIKLLDGMVDFASRTRSARLALKDPAGFVAGAYTRVRVLGTANVAAGVGTAVPNSSLVHRGALTGVFIVHDGHAQLRWLRLGQTLDEQSEVLGGLDRGDSVVVAPGALREGTAVRIGS